MASELHQVKAGDKIVLGFSGGLDTSYCVKYLTDEKGYEVHKCDCEHRRFFGRSN